MKYSVVIVTYNRLDLLKECVEHVLSQSIPASHIIIINNASTDGTRNYLDTLTDDTFVINNMEQNTGGAGGFYEGLRVASELQDDWTLIIDDDAILRNDFIRTIQSQIAVHPKVQAFAGAVYQNQHVDITHRQFMKRPGFLATPAGESEYNAPVFCCDFASFCGLMVKTALIQQIGLPEKDFFIWYDDTEYSIRIRKETPILVVPAAILDHKVAVPVIQRPRRYTWKDYYGLRNRLHMVQKHGTKRDVRTVRIHLFFHVWFRNFLFHIIHYQGYDWKYELETYHKALKECDK